MNSPRITKNRNEKENRRLLINVCWINKWISNKWTWGYELCIPILCFRPFLSIKHKTSGPDYKEQLQWIKCSGSFHTGYKPDLITFSSITRSLWKRLWYLLRNSGFSHLQPHYSTDRLEPCLLGKKESVGESLASEKQSSCLVEIEKIYLVQDMSLFPSDTKLVFFTLIHSGFVVMPTSNVVVSITKSCLTLWSHGLKHVRFLCTPVFPRICSNSWPLSWWCYLAISSSVVPFSFCPPSFPASRSFLMSWLLTSSDQSIGASASASVLQMNIQGWFPLRLIGLISLQSKGLSRVFFSTTVQKHQFFGAQPSLWSNSHIHTWLLEKP